MFFALLLVGRLQVAPGRAELRPRRSQEVKRSLELQNGGLRALEETWMMTFRLRHFPVKSGRFCALVGVHRTGRGKYPRSSAVLGGVGKARALERWPESTWGCLERRLRLTSPSVNDKHRCSRLEAESWKLKAGG